MLYHSFEWGDKVKAHPSAAEEFYGRWRILRPFLFVLFLILVAPWGYGLPKFDTAR